MESSGYARTPLSSSDRLRRSLWAMSSSVCQAADLIILGTAFFAVVLVPFFAAHTHLSIGEFLALRVSLRNILIAVACLSYWRVLLYSVGLYSPKRSATYGVYGLRLMVGLNVCLLPVAAAHVLFKPAARLWYGLLVFWVFSLLLMLALRAVVLVYDIYVQPRLRKHRNVVILGSGPLALAVLRELEMHPRLDYNLLGFIDSEPQAGMIPAEKILCGTDDLEDFLMHTVVDEVIVALPMASQYDIIGRAVAICEQLGIQSQYFTDHFGTSVTKRRGSAGPRTGRVVLQVVHNDQRRYMKRALDLAGAILGLILLSPVLLIAALAVKATSKGPIIFRQERFGLNKRRFLMLKFRSMVVDAEARQAAVEHLNETSGPAFKIKNDPRITSIGGFIRKMSIDELPQLVNVLKGDMSLVGPRPLPTRDVSRFSEAWLMRRFSVKPGLTCLWQVSGRSATDFDNWISLDLEYIDNWSLLMDMKILAQTVPAVLRGRGAS